MRRRGAEVMEEEEWQNIKEMEEENRPDSPELKLILCTFNSFVFQTMVFRRLKKRRKTLFLLATFGFGLFLLLRGEGGEEEEAEEEVRCRAGEQEELNISSHRVVGRGGGMLQPCQYLHMKLNHTILLSSV